MEVSGSHIVQPDRSKTDKDWSEGLGVAVGDWVQGGISKHWQTDVPTLADELEFYIEQNSTFPDTPTLADSLSYSLVVVGSGVVVLTKFVGDTSSMFDAGWVEYGLGFGPLGQAPLGGGQEPFGG